ncbi:hypothetical protein EV359DRAFT_68103, partial [Lentinula novae-zelandiae]
MPNPSDKEHELELQLERTREKKKAEEEAKKKAEEEAARHTAEEEQQRQEAAARAASTRKMEEEVAEKRRRIAAAAVARNHWGPSPGASWSSKGATGTATKDRNDLRIVDVVPELVEHLGSLREVWGRYKGTGTGPMQKGTGSEQGNIRGSGNMRQIIERGGFVCMSGWSSGHLGRGIGEMVVLSWGGAYCLGEPGHDIPHLVKKGKAPQRAEVSGGDLDDSDEEDNEKEPCKQCKAKKIPCLQQAGKRSSIILLESQMAQLLANNWQLREGQVRANTYNRHIIKKLDWLMRDAVRRRELSPEAPTAGPSELPKKRRRVIDSGEEQEKERDQDEEVEEEEE